MKKKGFKTLLLLSVLLTLTIALYGCTGDKAGDTSSSITIGIPQDIEDSLDPHVAVAAGTREVLFNMFEGLVKPDSDGNMIPAVASDWTISEDGTVYTFTLRDGIKFHNGNPVTVEDIKHSIDTCADTSNGTPLVEAFSNIKSVTIVDEKTVEIALNTANTEFIIDLGNFNAAIIPADNETPGTTPIGTGPYKYVSRSAQENFVMEKFDDYWGDKANIEHVTFKISANADSVVMDLLGGSLDMYLRLTPAQVDALNDEFTIAEGTMNLVQALYLNHKQAPFDNQQVRQALSYAVDTKELIDLVSGGKGVEIATSMYPSFGKYYDASLNELYNQDLDKAKNLLAEAGYPDGFTFTITVPSNYTQHVETAQVLAEQFKKIGVTAEIQMVEWESWINDVYLGREYQSTVIGVDASSLTAKALLQRFESTAEDNFTNYSNPLFDETFAKAMLETEEEAKTAFYKECLLILAEDAANVYIQDLPEFVAYNKKYAGYEFYPLYVQDISKLYLVEDEN